MKRKRPLVVLETPFAASAEHSVAEHIAFAKACLIDTLVRGEAAIASHLLWNQRGLLDDGQPLQRWAGMEAGLAWYDVADLCVAYTDLGTSSGMVAGMRRALSHGIPVERRSLPPVLRFDYTAVSIEWWNTCFNGWFDRSYPADLRPPVPKASAIASDGFTLLGADVARRVAEGERG